MDHTQPLLLARDLRVVFRGRGDPVVAVDGISLELERGRTLAVVGESGCGKSTLARALLRLVPLAAGSVVLEGTDITSTYGITFALIVIHALHVSGGMVPLSLLAWRARKDRLDSEHLLSVRACVVYWHFLEVVWVVLLAAFFLFG